MYPTWDPGKWKHGPNPPILMHPHWHVASHVWVHADEVSVEVFRHFLAATKTPPAVMAMEVDRAMGRTWKEWPA